MKSVCIGLGLALAHGLSLASGRRGPACELRPQRRSRFGKGALFRRDDLDGRQPCATPTRASPAGWPTPPKDMLASRRAHAELMFRRIGITFDVYGEKDATERLIPFDIIPRMLAALGVDAGWKPAWSSASRRSTASSPTSTARRRSCGRRDPGRAGLTNRISAPHDRGSACPTTSTCTSPASTWCASTPTTSTCWRTTCARRRASPTCWRTAR